MKRAFQNLCLCLTVLLAIPVLILAFVIVQVAGLFDPE
jgi:hypothetical protein